MAGERDGSVGRTVLPCPERGERDRNLWLCQTMHKDVVLVRRTAFCKDGNNVPIFDEFSFGKYDADGSGWRA
jgi:hypothetical protein